MKVFYYKILILILILNFSTFSKALDQKNPPKAVDGIQVHFDYTAHPAEREIAYRFYKKNYKYFTKENPLEKNQIGIYLHDLNDNGKEEILTYLRNPEYCGSAGCIFEILKLNDKDEYVDMGLNLAIFENVNILNYIHNGYKILSFYNWVWHWNGETYEMGKPFNILGKETGGSFHLGIYNASRQMLTSINYIDKISGKWTGKEGCHHQKDFLRSLKAQNLSLIEYNYKLWKDLKDYHKYVGKKIGEIELNKTNMITASYVVGKGGLKKYIDSKGQINIRDDKGRSCRGELEYFSIEDYDLEEENKSIINKFKNDTGIYFSPLPGYQVKFDYKNYPFEREIIWQYFLYRDKDITISSIEGEFLKKEEIGIDFYDIDNDGKKEALVYLINPAYCGNKGCEFNILKLNENNKCSSIGLTVNILENVKILETSKLNYQDLFLDEEIWIWNGKEYKLSKKSSETNN